MSLTLSFPLAAEGGSLEIFFIILLSAIVFIGGPFLVFFSEMKSIRRFRRLNYDDSGRPKTLSGRMHDKLGPILSRGLNAILIWIATAFALAQLFGPSFSALETAANLGIPTVLSVVCVTLIVFRTK